MLLKNFLVGVFVGVGCGIITVTIIDYLAIIKVYKMKYSTKMKLTHLWHIAIALWLIAIAVVLSSLVIIE